MGPLPKRKLSRARKGKRRAHDALSLAHLVKCDSCEQYKPAHKVCPHCGMYRGKQIFEIETENA